MWQRPDAAGEALAAFAAEIRGAARATGRVIVVGVTGPVAVGKSTIAHALGAAVGPGAAVVATDGFLFPNDRLTESGLLARKGFPETYDWAALAAFVQAVRARSPEARAPVYSHRGYDVVPGASHLVRKPDVLILEGLHLLHERAGGLLDHGIYVDADEPLVEEWFVARVVRLWREGANDPGSFYARFAGLTEDAVTGLAREVWATINRPNLVTHILPTRPRAGTLVEKGPDHRLLGIRRLRPIA